MGRVCVWRGRECGVGHDRGSGCTAAHAHRGILRGFVVVVVSRVSGCPAARAGGLVGVCVWRGWVGGVTGFWLHCHTRRGF